MSGIRSFGAFLALILTACSSAISQSGNSDAGGYVVGDEPAAVRAGVAVLREGGSAADAATATYFALAVTYPVAAGLGGGGVCLVYDRRTDHSETFIFTPRDSGSHGPFSLPGNVAGFAALQGAYGRLPWQRDVVLAEQLATAGFPVSEMLGERLAAAQNAVRLDAALAAEFLDESGHPKSAGSRALNADLGKTLALIRTNGSTGFYRGDAAAGIAAYSASQGSAITLQELADYVPFRVAAEDMKLGDMELNLPPRQSMVGIFANAVLESAQRARTQDPAADVGQLVTRATAQTLAELKLENLQRDFGSTGFAAVDSAGEAVACAVTMGSPFGAAHTAGNTGVTLGSAPVAGAGAAQAFLFPAIATVNGMPVLIGVGAGGPNASAALASLVLSRAGQGGPIPVRSTGTAPFDTVNVIGCGNGTCAAIPDPGAQGLGAAAER